VANQLDGLMTDKFPHESKDIDPPLARISVPLLTFKEFPHKENFKNVVAAIVVSDAMLIPKASKCKNVMIDDKFPLMLTCKHERTNTASWRSLFSFFFFSLAVYLAVVKIVGRP
jgi:hypothetical protein